MANNFDKTFLNRRYKRRKCNDKNNKITKKKIQGKIPPNMKQLKIMEKNNLEKIENIKEYELCEKLEKCFYCGAIQYRENLVRGKKFSTKEFKYCCNHGKVLGSEIKYPEFLKDLFTSENEESKNFLQNIRLYNASLAFACIHLKIEENFFQTGVPVLTVSGQYYYTTPRSIINENNVCKSTGNCTLLIH